MQVLKKAAFEVAMQAWSSCPGAALIMTLNLTSSSLAGMHMVNLPKQDLKRPIQALAYTQITCSDCMAGFFKVRANCVECCKRRSL